MDTKGWVIAGLYAFVLVLGVGTGMGLLAMGYQAMAEQAFKAAALYAFLAPAGYVFYRFWF